MTLRKTAIALAAVLAIAAAASSRYAEAHMGVGLSAHARQAGVALQADSRLYRHRHIVGSRGRTVCMTADPWSPEHMELDRRAGRYNHEGGPNGRRPKKHPLAVRQ